MSMVRRPHRRPEENLGARVLGRRPGFWAALVLACSLVRLSGAERELPIIGELGTGPVMDVAVDGERAFVIGRGKLHAVDIGEPSRPRVLGSLDGLGNTRQIAVADGVAYVSARESGLFIIDVRGAAPALISHYDSIEFATGVAVAGKVLFIAQRHFGVELVDVTEPGNPRHLSTIRTGEAQSVAYRDGMLYVGVWGTSELVTADVRDTLRPRIVSRVPLDGYGDGVAVHGGRLFAATGHHSRAPHGKPGDPGHGNGHGLEIFSLADPASPQFLGRVKFPRFYDIGNDMWDVQVAGTTAFVGDTHNGLFAVDAGDPAAPRIIARVELPKPSAGSRHADFVGGFGLLRDHVYVAGGETDTHIVAAKGLSRPAGRDLGAVPVVPRDCPAAGEGVYRPDGQVHAVAASGDLAVVACGRAGIHSVRIDGGLSPLCALPARGIVTDVCIHGDVVFAAEGAAGMSMWRLVTDGRLAELGRYEVPGRAVKYLSVPEPGRFALLQVGGSTVHIVDVSDPAHPRLAMEDTRHGLLYGHQLSDGLLGGRYAAVFWHVSGLHWYDLREARPVFAGQYPDGRFDPLSGIAVLGDHLIATRNGGLVRLGEAEMRPLDALPVHRAGKTWLTGKPVVGGGRVALANRALGSVFLLDVTEFEQPRLLDALSLEGNPGRVAFTRDGMLIPAGYDGLIKRDFAKGDRP